MIIQEFTTTIAPWNTVVFYHPSWRDLDVIIKTLRERGCEGDVLDDMVYMIEQDYLNTGFTWSDCVGKQSVIIIGQTTDAAQFNDTYDHEKGHLAMHISMEYLIDPFSEKYQYLTGEIGRLMFPAAKHFLCDHCRAEEE